LIWCREALDADAASQLQALVQTTRSNHFESRYMLTRWIQNYCRLINVLLVAGLALMVVLVFTNVVLRYVFNSGITLSEELSRWLFVWTTFLGAVAALQDRSHLGTDTLISRLPLAGKKFCLGLSLVLMLYVCWLVFQGGLEQTKINWDSTSPVMEVSMGYFYVSGVVFSVLGGLILLNNLWRLVSGQMTQAELIGVRESEDIAHADSKAR
jgi:TRAP-type transport system small permease protein